MNVLPVGQSISSEKLIQNDQKNVDEGIAPEIVACEVSQALGGDGVLHVSRL